MTLHKLQNKVNVYMFIYKFKNSFNPYNIPVRQGFICLDIFIEMETKAQKNKAS